MGELPGCTQNDEAMISQEEVQFYKSIPGELHTIFDVGCQHDNIFGELFPEAEVHLFDPVRSERLSEKIAGKTNIHYNIMAVGNEVGVAPFHPAYGSILLRTDEPKFDDHTEITVSIDSIYNYCFQQGIDSIDYLKIDTEGWDFEVILGCGDMLSKIKYIQFEDWSSVSGNTQTNKIAELLRGRHFTTINSKPINFVAVL
jgi:FkbM family methyltransferase